MKLIDKDALVAEIRKRFDEYSNSILKHYDACKEAKAQELGKVLIILDTLEVKEVDLKKEIENYLSSYWPNKKELHPFLGHMAKQFFELGVQIKNKVQKGK